MIKNKIAFFLRSYKILFAVYILVAAGAGIGQYLKTKPEEKFTKYNNYLIFRQSFPHLVKGEDLYKSHEPEHFDLYKYSPAFAVLMAPFAMFADLPGLIAWNLINAFALFFGIYFLPFLKRKEKIFALWFVLIELLTSLQNAQSNGLIAGLLLLSFGQFEKRNPALASLFIVLSAYIKIFGIAAVLLGLLYPGKLKFIAYTFFWGVLFALLPLVFTNWETLIMQYKSWYHLISSESTASFGISIFGILHSWFLFDSKNLALLIGFFILLAPLLRMRQYGENIFRLYFFASLLIWMIVFNHRGESPTYVIAVAGAAIWFFHDFKNRLDIFLILFLFVLTCLSPTDLFPRLLRTNWVVPYSLKALPCIPIWIKINYDLLLKKKIRVAG
jgi:hypothetical protein